MISDERIMDLWNEAIDEYGSNIVKFGRLLLLEAERHRHPETPQAEPCAQKEHA
jgi:hypothetical protein